MTDEDVVRVSELVRIAKWLFGPAGLRLDDYRATMEEVREYGKKGVRDEDCTVRTAVESGGF